MGHREEFEMTSGSDKEYYSALAQSVVDSDKDECLRLLREGLAQGRDPLELLDRGLSVGIKQVGEDFGEGRIFLPELIGSADVMQGGVALLDEKIKADGKTRKSRGKIVIGTVKGDIHDIGKSVVAGVLQANGYDVVDLGVDVDGAKFIAAAHEHQADCVAMSSLLTLNIEEMGRVITALKEAGLRDHIKVMVGGAPVTQEFADEIGADAFGRDATDAVAKANALMAATAPMPG
jgi:corrinoid protein of di/trimethylamine methyltransferase